MFDYFQKAHNSFGFPFSLQDMHTDDEENTKDMLNPMLFIQQAFNMQMQFAQYMFMMPFYMMKGFADMTGMEGVFPKEDSKAPESGFKVGNVNVPPEILGKLLSMDMSPENLEKLQKLLDFVFAAMPEGKSE